MENVEQFKKFIDKAVELSKELGAKALVIVTPSLEEYLPKTDIPVVVVGKGFDVSNEKIKRIPVPLSLGLKNILNLVSAFLLEHELIAEGDSFVYVTPASIGIRTAKKGGIFTKAFFSTAQTVLQRLLEITLELSLEWREGYPTGTMFVVGDTRNVLKHSHQMIPNPFKGHKLNVLDKKVKEVIKEYSLLDGAFIVSNTGRLVAAGRYIDVDPKKIDVKIPPGLGSRHIAAAGITKITKAIAITLSESGVIRMFKKGEIILEYNPRMKY